MSSSLATYDSKMDILASMYSRSSATFKELRKVSPKTIVTGALSCSFHGDQSSEWLVAFLAMYNCEM